MTGIDRRLDSAALPIGLASGGLLGILTGVFVAKLLPDEVGLSIFVGAATGGVLSSIVWAIDNVRLAVLGEGFGPPQPSFKPGDPVGYGGRTRKGGPAYGDAGVVVDIKKLGPSAPDGWDVLVRWRSVGVSAVRPTDLRRIFGDPPSEDAES